MKRLILLSSFGFLLSCAPSSYYFQVYTTSSPAMTDNASFIHGDFTLQYNMWENGGNSSFTLYNNSSNEITVLLDRSFLISNGSAYPLYSDMLFTVEQGQNTYQDQFYNVYRGGLTFRESFPAQTGTIGTSTTYASPYQIIIPSHSHRLVTSPALVSGLLQSCDINEKPRKDEEVTELNYSRDNSPYIFESSVSFLVNGEDSIHTLRPVFFVSSIKNISTPMMYTSGKEVDCDGVMRSVDVNVEKQPNKFYVRYTLF